MIGILATALVMPILAEPPGAGAELEAISAKAGGALKVTIKPSEARTAGARWRVDGGAWIDSGATLTGLATGGHTVSFKVIDGWKKPKNKQVTVFANATTATGGKYKPINTPTVNLPSDVPLEMVWIPAGSFMMGRYANEQDSFSAEDPQHQVTLAKGFWMSKYEVTQAQWFVLMGSNPSYFTGDGYRPVERVSWNDTQLFIAALNTHITNTGQGSPTFCLPSEAQWEYAYRAGTTTRFYWGDDLSNTSISGYAWHTGNSNEGGPAMTHPVGEKLPNAWGLYDMSGNVFEWCQDWYHADYTGAPTDGSAWGTTANLGRSLRGGSWFTEAGQCRAAARINVAPGDNYANMGFRLLRTQN